MTFTNKLIRLLFILAIFVSCRKSSEDPRLTDSRLKQIHYYNFLSDASPSTMEIYEFDLLGRKVVTRFYKPLSNGEYYDATYDSTFYRDGLPEETIRYARYIPTEPKILSKEVYHYQYGRLNKLENVIYNHQSNQFETYMYTMYSYAGNRETKRAVHRVNASGNAIWESVLSEYNSMNQLISEQYLNSQGEVKREVRYLYKDKLIKSRELFTQGIKTASFDYDYDSAGRKIAEKIRHQDPDGAHIEKIEFKY